MKKTTKILISLIVIVIALLTIVYVFAYRSSQDSSRLSYAVRHYLHLPAASVDGTWVPFALIDLRRDSARHFYENQDFAREGIRIDFDTPDGHKRLALMEKEVFDKIIEDTVIEHLAHKNGIQISDEEVMMELDRTLDDTDQLLAQERLQLYNFTKEEFATHVVRPQLYRTKLQAWYEKQYPPTEAQKEKIQRAQQALKKGTSFEAVAKEFSQGATAQQGGALGVVRKGQLDPALEDIAFSLEPGEVSDIIESPLGLHIIRVDKISNDASGERESVTLHHIFVKKNDFISYITQAVKDTPITIWHPRYRWDAQRGLLFFADQDLNDFDIKIQKELEQKIAQ